MRSHCCSCGLEGFRLYVRSRSGGGALATSELLPFPRSIFSRPISISRNGSSSFILLHFRTTTFAKVPEGWFGSSPRSVRVDGERPALVELRDRLRDRGLPPRLHHCAWRGYVA